MNAGRFLRRVFHRPPTIADCLHAAADSPCEPLRAPDERPRGVVSGPGLVARTQASRDAHLAPYRDDAGWSDLGIEWGPWSPECMGHDLPPDAA